MNADKITYIHTLDGKYLGFISDDNLYSRDGIFLGWVDNMTVWDQNGRYRGKVIEIRNHSYILREIFSLSPLPRPPRSVTSQNITPVPVANIAPIAPTVGVVDGFSI